MTLKKIFTPFAALSAILLIWQAVYLLELYPSYLFPSPLAVLNSLADLAASGDLLLHIRASLARFLTGYLAAVVLAVMLGLFLGRFQSALKAVDPLIQILRPISPVAWMPLLALWVGIGNIPAVIIIFMAAFYPVLLSTVAATRDVEEHYLKVAGNFGSSELQTLGKVIVPAAFPAVAVGLRIAVGSAWVFLVAGEMMGVRAGLGFLIVDARNALHTETVMAAMLLIGLLGLLLDRLIGMVEHRVRQRWGEA